MRYTLNPIALHFRWFFLLLQGTKEVGAALLCVYGDVCVCVCVDQWVYDRPSSKRQMRESAAYISSVLIYICVYVCAYTHPYTDGGTSALYP